MSRNPQTIIRETFQSIERKWSGLKFLEYLGICGSIICLGFFALEECAERNYLTSQPLFITILFVLGILSVSVVPGILIAISLFLPNRRWIAEQIERDCPGLLDRVHTLVHLEKKHTLPGFKRRIEAQAAIIITKKEVRSTLSPSRALFHMSLFVLMLIGTIWYGLHYQPFATLLNPLPVKGLAPQQDNPLELAPTKPTPPPAPTTWGEVRIVDPGRDLRLTKIDVVQLQIEMATSAPLTQPEWITSVNGGPEMSHPLPPPAESQYAVYQPLFYLDELNVQDWDMVTYYARVKTTGANTYQSKIFLIEIKPFKEDFFKGMGGGGKGEKRREEFAELNELIHKQTELLQQTHLFPDQSYPTPAMRDQDAVKLSANQGDLAQATDHFYGEVAAEDKDEPIIQLLNYLSQAVTAMNKSADDLHEEVIPQAETDERTALADLIASRKNFLKTLGGGAASGSSDQERNPDAPSPKDPAQALSQVSEVKDREESAINTLAQLKARQEALAASRGSTAQSEQNLKDQVNQLMANNEDLFPNSKDTADKFNEDADRAQKELTAGVSRETAHHYMNQAAADLGQLQKDAQASHQMNQMAEAYELKKILEQNAAQLAKEQKSPGTMSPHDKEALSDTASNAASALKDIADKPDSGFNPNLSQSLTPDKQAALQQALDKLKNSGTPSDSQKAAGDAHQQISQIAKAFDKSVPTINQMVREKELSKSDDDSPAQPAQPNPEDDAITSRQLETFAQAYRLKQAIDMNAIQLGQEQQTAGSLSPSDKDEVGQSTTAAIEGLKQMADAQDSIFGPELGQALSPEKQAALQDALNRLKNAQPGPASQQAAGDAKQILEEIREAFDHSAPRLGETEPAKPSILRDPVALAGLITLSNPAILFNPMLQDVLSLADSATPTPEPSPKPSIPVADGSDAPATDVKASQQMHQLSQAYQLKKILDLSMAQLDQENQKPGTITPGDKEALTQAVSTAASGLKQIADQPDIGVGPGLAQSLSDDKQAALQKSLNQLKDAAPGADSQKAASVAKDQINQIGDAFNTSVPSLSLISQKGNQMKQDPNGQSGQGQQGKPSGQSGAGSGDTEEAQNEKEYEQLNDVQKQIQSLMLQKNDVSDPQRSEDQKQEMDGMMSDLNKIMHDQSDAGPDKKPDNEDAAIVAAMNTVKKKSETTPVPKEELKKLLDAIIAKSGSIEDAKTDKPEAAITLIDDSKLPPNYRNRIHHYYQQLSNAPR